MMTPGNRKRQRSIFKRKRNSKLRLYLVLAILVFFFLGLSYIIFFRLPLLETVYQEAVKEPTIVDLFNEQKFEEAIRLCEAVIKDDPISIEAYKFSGFSHFYLAAGHYHDSIEKTEAAAGQAVRDLRISLHLSVAQSNNVEPEIYWILGKAYFFKQRFFYDEAIKYLQIALNAGFESIDIYEYLGIIYAELENYQKSAESYEKAISLDPKPVYFLEKSRAYLALAEYADAESSVRKALGLINDINAEEKCRMTLAEIYVKQDNYPAARNEYETILQASPNSPEARSFLGNVYEQEGDFAAARYQWRQAIELDPGNQNAIKKLNLR